MTLFNVKTQSYETVEEMASSVSDDAIILLGETHYEQSLTNAQGQFIEKVVTHKNAEGNFSTAWEFMDYPRQNEVEMIFNSFVSGEITSDELLTGVFPGVSPEQNRVYLPLFDITKKYQGTMLATNAPRLWKRIIVQDGIDALDSEFIPLNMRRGSDDYFQRFVEAIGGHGDPSSLEGYFMAQSYTDAVMAEQLYRQTKMDLQFMIVGYFHNDYDHGLPWYLKSLTAREVINVRMVLKGQENVEDLKKEHPKFGYVADYLLIVGD